GGGGSTQSPNQNERKRFMKLQEAIRFFVSPPTSGSKATLALRLMAGAVFFWEGLLKFAYANQGVGRFTKRGMPMPEVLAPAIAVLEIGGGLLLMSGLGTRLISVPFIIEMIVAMLSTKITLYLGTSPLPAPPAPPVMGGWAVLHEIRSEYAQIMTSIYLLAAGPGPWSLDALLLRRHRSSAVDGSCAGSAARPSGRKTRPLYAELSVEAPSSSSGPPGRGAGGGEDRLAHRLRVRSHCQVGLTRPRARRAAWSSRVPRQCAATSAASRARPARASAAS